MSDDDFPEDKGELRGVVENDSSIVDRSPSVTADLNTVFSLLSNEHCRYLLYYLVTKEGEVAEIDDAVKGVSKYKAAGEETDKQVNREKVRIELHHSLLPKLRDAEVIDYDQRHGTIRFTGDSALVEWVDHAQHEEVE
ncbi:DUF7344 domain-containing protein [Halorussus halophilus]|uniref:DUF7344 domain-containing protein n=1 Tax=Halorussus halophilus TaxID=2650975 RepID=UPI0013014717|nr:hypothetical protein [Halorussus halophilus]